MSPRLVGKPRELHVDERVRRLENDRNAQPADGLRYVIRLRAGSEIAHRELDRARVEIDAERPAVFGQARAERVVTLDDFSECGAERVEPQRALQLDHEGFVPYRGGF